jgi:hypothetical protein
LEITTKLGCALACRFCPQDRLVRSYPAGATRLLSLADFVAVEAKLPPWVRVDFSGMAEPWLNPDATAMVVHAFERGRRVALYTTLQGMPPADAGMLIERFAGRISPETPWVIHLPDRHGNMPGWRCSPAYLAALGRFVALRRDRAPEGLAFMTMSPDGALAAELAPVLDERLAPFTAISRVENLARGAFRPGELLAAVRQAGAVLCGSTPFFDHNTMLPNGDVVLCCMDYGRAHVLGNLLRQDYAAVMGGAPMTAVRLAAMGLDDAAVDASGRTAGSLICRQCHNAVALDQEGGTHWRAQGDAAWTRRAASPAAPPAPPGTTERRGLLRRLMRA